MLSPQDALSDCTLALPAFGPYWAEEDSFRSEEGAFTVCGVYLTLGWFLHEHWRVLTEQEWRALAALVSDHERRSADPASEVGACLCESLEGEDYSPLVARYFDPKLLARYGTWA